MSVIYIGSDSDSINSLRWPAKLAKFIAFNNYDTIEDYLSFIENENSEDYGILGQKCNVSNNIVTFSKTSIEHKNTLKELWGFDYVIQIEETENDFPIILSSNLEELLIDNFFDFEKKPLEENYLAKYKYDKDYYNTIYLIIKLNPNLPFGAINEIFFNISKNIRNISNYNRWFHCPKGWLKSKQNSNYIKKAIKDSLFEDCLFYMDDSVEFKEGKTVFNRQGIVKTGKIEFDSNYPTFYNPHRFIYIPEGERVGVSGWIKINNEWFYFNPDSFTGGDEKIIIDGIQYELKLAKLMANHEDFYLDDLGILHHKEKEDK